METYDPQIPQVSQIPEEIQRREIDTVWPVNDSK